MAQQIRLPIYSLAGGVGRQPVTKRLPSEAQELNNVFLTIENSFEKRNGFEYIPGKAEEYSEDLNLAPSSLIFNTLDLSIGGGTGSETYIPDDEDDFFFKWITIDENNEFLIAINVSLVQKQPTITEQIREDGTVFQSELQGSTQDFEWNDFTNEYKTGFSLNFKKKFITVWKVEEKNLSIQSVDYDSVTKDVINYIQEGYKTGEANNLIKLKSFGTSAMLLNKEVKAGYKELYQTDFNENPINTEEFSDSTAILIKPAFNDAGFFDGYKVDTQGSILNQKTFNDFNTNSPSFRKGDIIKIYDSSNSVFIAQFVLLKDKSRFSKINFTKEDIGREIGVIPETQDGTNYRIRLIKTQKQLGGERIRYRTSAFPRSLGFQAPVITETTKLINLNGIDMNSICSRFNPDGSDFQSAAGCGWNFGELNHNFALGTFWYQNGASTTQVDLNIVKSDADATIQTLIDIVSRSGGNVKLKIDEDNNGLVICDRITEEPVPIITKFIDVGGEGCVKFDNTADRLGLTSYGEKNINPLGVGQIKEIFQNELEFVFARGAAPLGTGTDISEIDPNWYPGHSVGSDDFLPDNLSAWYNSFLNNPVVSRGANQYGIQKTGAGITEDDIDRVVRPAHFIMKQGDKRNSFVNLMFPFHALVSKANGIAPTTDDKNLTNEPVVLNGTIEIESTFSGSVDSSKFSGLNTEGTRFSGSWSFRYPSDTRTFGTQTDTTAVPDATAPITWNIGKLTITIDEEGEGYSNGRFDTQGNPPSEGGIKDIKVTFKDMPKFKTITPDNRDCRPDINEWLNGERVEYVFNHRSQKENDTFLFNPHTLLREVGILSQKAINNVGIIKEGITNDVSEPIDFKVNLTNSNATVPGTDDKPTNTRYAPITSNDKGVVLRPSDTLTTLNHFIRIATSPVKDNVINLENSTHALTLNNDSNSVVVKKIKGSTGSLLEIPKSPFITDVDFFVTTDSSSLYANKEMNLNFTDELKIKYNRSKHQPIGDNVILSTSTGLDIGQSVENFSLLPIPPINDDDFTDLNGAEESLAFLYSENTVGDLSGKGKVFVTRESYLTKPAGFFRTVSFEDKGSPFYEQVRAEDPYGSFDTKTMPLLFDFVTSENTWRFIKTPYKDRLTGTLATNPGPSAFVGANNERVRKKINDITFWRDRFWMCAEDNVFCFKVGDFFNLWLDDPDNIVDTDPIDVRTGRGDLVTISHLVPFESYMFVSTLNDMQFELLGSENQITPLTAELQATAFYSTDPVSEPQLLGSQIYFFAPQKIYLYYGSGSTNVSNAAEVTFQAEGYLPKSFKDIATSAIKSMISLIDADNQNILYFYTSRFSGDKLIQNSLHKWITSTKDKIKSINFIDDILYSVVLRPYKRPNGEESGQFFVQKASVITEPETYPRIDRRISMPLTEDMGRVSEVDSDWGEITSFEINFNNTTGYQAGDSLTFNNKNVKNGTINENPGSGLELKVTETDSNGKITKVSLLNGGSGYLVPDDVGISATSTFGNLIADTSAGMTAYAKQGSNASVSVGVEAITDAIRQTQPSSSPTEFQVKNGVFSIRPTAVKYKVPFGYNVGDVITQKTATTGSGLSIKILSIINVGIGFGDGLILADADAKFGTFGIPSSWEVVNHGKGFTVGEEVTMLPLSGTDTGARGPGGQGVQNNLPQFKVKSLITSESLNTIYDSSSDTTTFKLPVQNDEINQAIVGLNQPDIGEELTIVSSTSDNGKKTRVVVQGDQRSSNVTSSEDYGQIDTTASSFEDYGRNSDKFIQEKLEYGILFNFLSDEQSKTENWFGTSFTMTATLSEIVFRDQNNNALDGVLNIKNVSMKFYRTGKFNFQVKRKQFNNNTDIVITDPFYKERINSESFDSSQLSVQENGEFMAKVMSFAPNAEISFVSDYHQPVNIANIEFRGIFSPRMSSIRN